MHELIARKIVDLKKEFIKKHEATGFIYEVIPLSYSIKLPIEDHADPLQEISTITGLVAKSMIQTINHFTLHGFYLHMRYL
jgi:hypothetical protein